MSTEELLAERGKTHGFFPDHAAVTQAIKRLIFYPKAQVQGLSANTETETVPRYDAVEREGLEMIAHKIGRIVTGNPHLADHWADIAGYARLVADHLERVAPRPAEPLTFRPSGRLVVEPTDEFRDTPPPAPPPMRDTRQVSCALCGAPDGTHYGACPNKAL